VHEHQYRSSDLSRQNEELKADLERQKLRVQSLQTHIETLQRYGGGAGGPGMGSQSEPILPGGRSVSTGGEAARDEELRRAQEMIEKLRRENEQSQRYIQAYETQIKDLEHEVSELGKE
jgi:septal ring factor EnvC (AmiA/AmiB activator)